MTTYTVTFRSATRWAEQTIRARTPRAALACGDTDHIDISAEVWVRLTPDGADADASGDGSHLWDDGSPALCGACGFHGSVADLDPDREADAR